MVHSFEAFHAWIKQTSIVVLVLGIAACGGGGGGSGSQSPVQVLLSDGDVLPGDFTIGTIEEANMAADRSVVLIASGPTLPADRGVFLRSPDGSVTPILSPATQVPEGISLPTLHSVSMASTGEFLFQAGGGLDSDSLFVFANGQLSVLAQAGQTPAGFRVLGERQIGAGGLLGFTAGTSPCSTDSSSGSERDRCTLEIFSGSGAGIAQVGVPNDLTNQDPGTPGVVVNDSQALVLGLPGRINDPAIAMVRNGQFSTLVKQRQVVSGLGTLSSLRPRAMAPNGDLLFDARVDTDGDGQPDDARVLLLSAGNFTTIARTGEPAGSKVILDVRGIEIDGAGRVVFFATFGDPGQSTGLLSLRVWESGVTREIAFDGEKFGQDAKGNDLQIIEISQIRVAANGDIVFRATLGTVVDGTPKVSETRILRDAAGQISTLLQTGTEIAKGQKIVSVAVSDLTGGGDLLSITSINRSANRALLLLPRQ